MNRVFILFIGLLTLGCSPYTSFYKETYGASQDISNKKKVYRLVLNGYNQSKNIQFKDLDKLASFKLSNLSTEQVNEVLYQLPNPEKLKILILDSLDLSSFPNAISRFVNLNQISLNHNPQFNFDEAFKKLKGIPIEFLNLQHNQLTQLPESIKELKSLKDLNLSNNMISGNRNFKLLAQLPRLNSLWITNNKLNSIPLPISELTQLKNLYIEHNELRNIPMEVKKMKGVRVIHAGHNHFQELPAAFAEMPSLILLHVNNCYIKNIPRIYGTKESNVLGLILDNNELSNDDKLKWRKIMDHYFLLSF